MLPKLALAAFFVFLGFLVYSANNGQWPAALEFYMAIPFGDKVGHFFLAGTFAFLATWASKARAFSLGRFRIPIGAAVVFLIICLEEISQIFVPGRTFSLLDLFADVLGILAGSWLACRLVYSNKERRIARETRQKTRKV
jgi:VanZ family protein